MRGVYIAIPVVASGSLATISAFLFLGWASDDRRLTCTRWAQTLRRDGARIVASLEAMVRRVLRVEAPSRASATLSEVSEMIDIVRLGLSAGLSFDAAVGMYCDGRSGGLSTRLAQARVSWQSGLTTREEELQAVAHEVGLRALEVFAVAVSQALELGAPLSETLEGQSREIRAAHRAEVERQIERAPVKLLIPTGALILPALLLSILGPLLAAGGMM